MIFPRGEGGLIQIFIRRIFEDLAELIPFMSYYEDSFEEGYYIYSSLDHDDAIMQVEFMDLGSYEEITIFTGSTHIHVYDEDDLDRVERAINALRSYLMGDYYSVLFLKSGDVVSTGGMGPLYVYKGIGLYYLGGTTMEIEKNADVLEEVYNKMINFTPSATHVLIEHFRQNKFYLCDRVEDRLKVIMEDPPFKGRLTPSAVLMDVRLRDIFRHVGREMFRTRSEINEILSKLDRNDLEYITRLS